MASSHSNKPADLLALARTSAFRELIEALEEDATLQEEPGPVPPRANQLARLVLSKAIRTIRLGAHSELAEAGAEVLRLLARPEGKVLEERFPEAHRLLSGAAVALRAATAPSSAGGEVSVLRGWSENALRTLEWLNEGGGSLSRSQLREWLKVDESYLSHMLGAMEAAGLVVRVRDGRTITVHVGPSSQSDYVREFLSSHGNVRKHQAERVTKLFQAVLEGGTPNALAAMAPGVAGVDDLVQQLREIRYSLKISSTEITDVVAGEEKIVCGIRLTGTMQLGREDGSNVDRWLVWVAVLGDGAVSKVETWSSLQWVPRPVGAEMPPAKGAAPVSEAQQYTFQDVSAIQVGVFENDWGRQFAIARLGESQAGEIISSMFRHGMLTSNLHDVDKNVRQFEIEKPAFLPHTPFD